MNKNTKIQDVVLTGMMAALVFVGTYFLKVPTPTGYTHLGDCIIIATVCLFGTKKGVLAGSIGAGLSDLLGGYMIWVVPTILIKGLMAFVMGTVAYKLLPKVKFNWLIGAIVGGMVHTAGYTIANIVFYGLKSALVEMGINAMQTVCGIVFGAILYSVLRAVPVFKNMNASVKA